MPNFPCPNMCGIRRKKLAIIECNMLLVYGKENIVFILLPQCGSPAFLINCDNHNFAVKEHCVSSLDLQHKTVKWLREFRLFFFFFKGDTALLSLYREEWFTGHSKTNRLGIPRNEHHTQDDNTLFHSVSGAVLPETHLTHSYTVAHITFVNIAFADTKSDLSVISTGANYHQLNYGIWHKVGFTFHCLLGGEAFPQITGELWLIVS